MNKNLILLTMILMLYNNVFASSTTDSVNEWLGEIHKTLITKPQTLLFEVSSPDFQEKILPKTIDSKDSKGNDVKLNLIETIKNQSRIVGLSLVFVFVFISLLGRSVDLERFDIHHIVSEIIKGCIIVLFINNHDAIIQTLLNISKFLMLSISPSSLGDTSTIYSVPANTPDFVALLLGVLGLVVILFTAFVLLLLSTTMIIRVIKLAVFQMLLPLYLSFFANEKTSSLAVNYIYKYFVVLCEIIIYIVILNLLISIPDQIKAWFPQPTNSAAATVETYGGVLLSNLVLGVILYGLIDGKKKLMETFEKIV